MKRLALLTLMAMLCRAAAAEATISFNVDGLGRAATTAEIDLTYSAIDGESALMTIQVTNSSEVGSRLTGFAFNLPSFGGAFTTIAGVADGSSPVALAQPAGWALPEGSGTSESGWFAMYDLNGIKTPSRGGDFDFGILNNNNPNAFLTGGVGNGPVILNQGEDHDATTFSLTISGTGLNSISNTDFEALFFDELSDGSDQLNFAVLFEGFRRLGRPGKDGLITASTPVPPAVILCAMGLLSAGMFLKRLAPNHRE